MPSDRIKKAKHINALLWKNWLIKKRHVIATFFEIVMPVAFIILFGGLKTTEPNVNVPAGWSSDSTLKGQDTIGRSFNLFRKVSTSSDLGSFKIDSGEFEIPSYYFTESTLSGILLGMSLRSVQDGKKLNELSTADRLLCTAQVGFQGFVSTNSSSPFAVPAACDGRVIPYKIGIAPDNDFTRNYFYDTISKWYPRVSLMNTNIGGQSALIIPSLEDSVTWFKSGKELEDYVSGEFYAKDLEHPRIFGGIVFNKFPSDSDIGKFVSIEYSIRLNATTDANFNTGDVPKTNGEVPKVDDLQKSISIINYATYAVRGFMTFQTLVNRFLNCMPEWDSTSRSTTGKCQAEDSEAIPSAELNDTLFKQVENDLIIANAASQISQLSSDAGIDIPEFNSSSIDEEEKLKLIVPLLHAPQPFLGSTVYPFPIEEYISAPFYDLVKDVFALAFILSYLYAVSRVLTVFILEKETRSRELMKIMGIKERSIITSWYITYVLIGFCAAVLQTIASKIGLFENSNIFIVFVFFFLFSLDVLAFGYLVSTFFSKARTGSFTGIIIFFMMYFITSGFNQTTSELIKSISCIFPPVALSLGVEIFANVESVSVGLTFSNIGEVFENFRFTTSLIFMIIDFFLYTALAIYFEQVIPKEYGVVKPWYFPFSAKYWRSSSVDNTNQQLCNSEGVDSVEYTRKADYIEPVNVELRQQEESGQAFIIKNLKKTFPVPGGEKTAVDSLNLVFYEGQITCLLGHNGAGKTTTISMLTGMTPPTSGTAIVGEHSITENMDTIRESLGMCPQHDVLYDELTVEEHLTFYARVKGYNGQELHDIVIQKTQEVGLTEKVKTFSSNLSGGMKRKLSVAIALLGDTRVVFLDEPTSGMDPYSRRSTWELLQNNRHGRIMVLTTHFMDEADLLGDRIAIMAEGQLRCCGSSFFLKNRFGAGYNLTLVKGDACLESKVIEMVKNHVKEARLLSNVGTEISFQLPIESCGVFSKLFEQLDNEKDLIHIEQYGISVTTMEEVFLKVAESGDLEVQKSYMKNLSERKLHSENVFNPHDLNKQTVVSRNLFFVHLHALLLKRLNNAKRDRKALLFSITLPVLLLALGLILLKTSGLTNNQPKVILSSSDFQMGSQSPTPYFCQENIGDWCTQTMGSTFTGSTPSEISSEKFEEPPYDTTTPTVFKVKYTDPSIEPNGSTGFSLKLGEMVYDLGYNDPIVKGQFGGFLVYGSSDDKILGYNIITNTTSLHSAPIFKTLIDQSLYRRMSTDSSNAQNLDITVINHPLPLTASTKALFNSFLSFTACIFIMIAFAFFPASIITFIVKEKEMARNAKHQQLISGINLPAFWMSNYIWDFSIYIIPFAAALIMIQAFDITSFTGSNCTVDCTSSPFAAVVVLFLLFGLSICPFTYTLSFVFKEHSSAQNLTLMLNFVLGVVLLVVSFALDVIDSTKDTNEVLKFFWRFSPLFNLGNGLLNLSREDIVKGLGFKDSQSSAFDLDITGWEILYLAIETVVFTVATVMIDLILSYPKIKAKFFHDPIVEDKPIVDDSDVEKESERVHGNKQANDIIQLKNIRKVYKGGKVAVRNLSFGLSKGECFGFLGINGAGKTSTLKVLTGAILPTRGEATLGGFDIMTQQLDVRRLIGYCPQFDALLDLLTVREHLELYGRIKGVPSDNLNQVVIEKIEQLGLSDFENKLAGTLSGGNKRKLSVAIALIGSPPIIFLDEPSTGMDPVSRRFMWDVISEISTENKESTIVLTTHSMEECEALCTKVGIMVGGRLRCLGSVQHLKGKFGHGYMTEIKLESPSIDEIKRIGSSKFNNLIHLNHQDVKEACSALGNPKRVDLITMESESGWVIADTLNREGLVSVNEFIEWWILEDHFDHLMTYMKNTFEYPELVERHGDQCRFKIHDSITLSSIFDKFEKNKEKYCIKEYSLSQTSLEQIFNQFASQQEEEMGVSRGMNVQNQTENSYYEVSTPRSPQTNAI